MSKVITKVDGRDLAHIVEQDGQYYYVDSALTFDNGYETMIFRAEPDEDGPFNGFKVDAWADLYCERYLSPEHMVTRHAQIIEAIAVYVI